MIADGGIRRDATLSLAALRLLSAGSDEKQTLALRRYILGIGLTAFTCNATGQLRQGCLLVLDPEKGRTSEEVYPSGERKPLTVTHEAALKYATKAAKAFGVGTSLTVPFDKALASADVSPDAKAKPKAKAAKK